MDKKYTSLEHSIRNIMTESISPIGSDEFKGTPKAFLKPAPRIAPKKGDTHPDGTTVLAQRGSAKIGQSKSGGTMSEEQLIEAGGVDPSKSTYRLKPMSDEDKEKLKKQLEPFIEFGKDITPILGTYRQGERTVEAGKETAKEFEKGNYWNAAKGAAYTAGQGVLTGVSGVGDILTATMVGAPIVAGAKTAAIGTVRALPKIVPAAVDMAKSLFAGKKVADVIKTAPDAAKVGATQVPKVTTQMTSLPGVEIKGGGVNVIQKPPAAVEPKVQKPTNKPEKIEQPIKPDKAKKSEDASTQPQTQGNAALKLEPEKKSADIEKSGYRSKEADNDKGNVADIKKYSKEAKPNKFTLTPDEIAKEMDKFRRQQPAVVKEPPSKQSINPKEFYGKPAPKSIETPANVNVQTKEKTAKTAVAAPVASPVGGQLQAPVISRNAAAPAQAPAQAQVLAPAQAPAPAQAQAQAQPKPQAQPEPAKRKDRKEKEQKRKRLPFGLKIPGVSDNVLNGLRGFVPAAQYVHYEPQGFMENSKADNIRKTIENVARPGGKTRIAKQGEIKAKIIDENAKRASVIKKTVKDSSTIIKNPKLKHPELDEN